jgi:hypothetical protein
MFECLLMTRRWKIEWLEQTISDLAVNANRFLMLLSLSTVHAVSVAEPYYCHHERTETGSEGYFPRLFKHWQHSVGSVSASGKKGGDL